jgi:muramoyltetrapeptide carboxypeptidase LdcA involved in peptidoglycan recycling
MQTIYPKKLLKGDKIMVVAPARSCKILSEDTIQRAVKSLNELGLEVVF